MTQNCISNKNKTTFNLTNAYVLAYLIILQIHITKLINKENILLYSIPYQHFTNAIENYFSILKSKLQKLDGLTYDELIQLTENIRYNPRD